jgi:apurinic endonuclease APN1
MTNSREENSDKISDSLKEKGDRISDSDEDKKTYTKIIFLNPDLRLGFHIGKEKSITESILRLIHTPLQCYQIFISNGRSFALPKTDIRDLLQTHIILKRLNKYMCIHGNYLYNPAGSAKGSKDEEFEMKHTRTCKGILGELDRGVALGVGVVVHIGSCCDKDLGMKTINKTLQYVLTTPTIESKNYSKEMKITEEDFISRRRVILENCAGEGNKIGKNIKEIGKIFRYLPTNLSKQVTVCLDTAHLHGAGDYDLGKVKDVDKLFADVDRYIGFDRLELFHLNDSKVELGGKKDMHENLGKGKIFAPKRHDGLDGRLGLVRLVKIAESKKIPLIGEPPGDGIDDYEFLKGLVKLEL